MIRLLLVILLAKLSIWYEAKGRLTNRINIIYMSCCAAWNIVYSQLVLNLVIYLHRNLGN